MESILRTRADGRAAHDAGRLLRARRPAAGQPAGDREPHQGRRVRLHGPHARAPADPVPIARARERPAPAARARRGPGVLLRSAGGRADAAQSRGGGRRAGVGRRSAPGLREGGPRLLRLRATRWPASERAPRRSGRHRRRPSCASRGRGSRVALCSVTSPRIKETADQERQPDGVRHAGGHGRARWRSPCSRSPSRPAAEPSRARASRSSCAGGSTTATRGRVVLAEDVRLLEQRRWAPAAAPAAQRQRARRPAAVRRARAAAAADARRADAALRRATRASSRCSSTSAPARPRSRDARPWRGSWMPAAELVAKLESLLGSGGGRRSSMPDALDFEQPLLELETRIAALQARGGSPAARATRSRASRSGSDRLRQRTYANLTAWQRTQLARHPSGRTRARLEPS